MKLLYWIPNNESHEFILLTILGGFENVKAKVNNAWKFNFNMGWLTIDNIKCFLKFISHLFHSNP